jgi:hypothetical protein
VTFADEGVGMDERTRDGYFQPFRSAFEEGTGLGAAIVYRLVEEHGDASSSSSPGREPRSASSCRVAGRAPGRASDRSTAEGVRMNRVLVVEDEKSMRDLLSLMLRKEGTPSRSPTAAPRRLPASRRIRSTISSSPTSRCRDDRARAAAARAQGLAGELRDPDDALRLEGNRHRGSERGRAYYVEKPFDLDEMKVVARRTIDQKRIASENADLKSENRGLKAELKGVTGSTGSSAGAAR